MLIIYDIYIRVLFRNGAPVHAQNTAFSLTEKNQNLFRVATDMTIRYLLLLQELK